MTGTWLSLESLSKVGRGGKAATLRMVETVGIYIEASPDERDVRLETPDHIVKITFTSQMTLCAIYVDDRAVWTADN